MNLSKIKERTSSSIFWGWNIIFILFVFLGIFPFLKWDIWKEVLTGRIPFDFMLSLLFLIIIPFISTGIVKTKNKDKPYLDIHFFFGIEAPIFLLCILRLFIIREITFASGFLITSIIFSACLYAYNLLTTKPKISDPILLILNSFVLVTALYISLIVLIYAIPIAIQLIAFLFDFIVAFFQFNWISDLIDLIQNNDISAFSLVFPLWLLIGFLLFAFSSYLFILLPIFLPYFYIKSWICTFKKALLKLSKQTTFGLTALSVFLWVLIFTLASNQPQVRAFKLLSEPASTQEQKQEVLNNINVIRKGLLNAYLHKYRYIRSEHTHNNISKMYDQQLNAPDKICTTMQKFYDILVQPLTYKGKTGDINKAKRLYADIFDASIQKRESKAIIKALNATYDRDEAKAGVINVNQKRVLLTEQHITTSTNETHTDIEIYEVYENQLYQDQEVFYYFSLPDNSAITGLWLGRTSNRQDRDAFIVSPRGAAQKVYKTQMVKKVDPALIEQVGPKQYRLRVFPIPSKEIDVRKQPKMHLWLTYSVLNNGCKSIMPKLLEKRNVYWNRKTKRTFNNKKISRIKTWVPEKSECSDFVKTNTYLSNSNNEYIVTTEKISSNLIRPNNENLAVLIDTSYSMLPKRNLIIKNIAWLQQQPSLSLNIYVYPINEDMQKIGLNSKDLDFPLFYGSSNFETLWDQATNLENSNRYDAIIILTDEGSYELSKQGEALPKSNTPIWFVHLDKLAPAYSDEIISEIYSSGGNITDNLKNAYNQIIIKQKTSPNERVYDDVIWSFKKQETSVNNNSNDKENNLSAKMLIDYLASKQSNLSNKFLDEIHKIAKEYSVVTPYSSMIVLVNETQKLQLRKAEKQKDRFSRPIDKGEETLTQPRDLSISAVPEPEEWVLLIIVIGSLLFLIKHKKLLLKLLNQS